MPPVVKYCCALCREPLKFCFLCERYVHAPRWVEHLLSRHCVANTIGTDCEPLLSSLDRMVARLVRIFALCTCALVLTWLLWAQAVDAWDASYRAGWLP